MGEVYALKLLPFDAMVTPRNVYTFEEKQQLVENPLKLITAYGRDHDRKISIKVRYDPHLSHAHDPVLDQLVLDFSDGPFFLLKLHYEQVRFTIHCLKWNAELSYEEFKSLFYELASDPPPITPALAHLTLDRNGDIHAQLLELPPEPSILSGLSGLMRPQNTEILFACIDTAPTLPCYATSFDTADSQPYENASKRVQELCLSTDTETEDGLENEIDDLGSETPDLADGLGVPELQQILPLMFNPTHHIMSCRDWTVAVLRNNQWLTPHITSGCRNDPLRMLLLDAGILRETSLRIQGLEADEDVLLISAVYGIRHARVIGEPPSLLYKYTRSRKPKANPRTEKIDRTNAALAAEQASQALASKTPIGNKIPNTNVFRIDTKHKKAVYKAT